MLYQHEFINKTRWQYGQHVLGRKRDHIRRIQRKHNLSRLDAKALDNYFSSSYKSFVTNDQTGLRIWLDVVPDLAYNHLFLLQGILASKYATTYGIPKSYKTADIPRYTLHACAHQDWALPQFRHAIHHFTVQTKRTATQYCRLPTYWSFIPLRRMPKTPSTHFSLWKIPTPTWTKRN